MIGLWHYLLLVCLVTPIGGALASAKLAGVGFGGYVLAIAVGLAVGACTSWTMWSTHRIVATKLRRHLDSGHSVSEWYFRLFYFSKIVWIGFASWLGAWLSSLLLRLVS